MSTRAKVSGAAEPLQGPRTAPAASSAPAAPAARPQPTPRPAALLDARGLTCGQLEPLLAERLRALAPGEVLEVRSDEPAAEQGIASWVWLSGHTLVAAVPDGPERASYFVKKAEPAPKP